MVARKAEPVMVVVHLLELGSACMDTRRLHGAQRRWRQQLDAAIATPVEIETQIVRHVGNAGIDASGKLVGLNVGYSFAFAEYTVLSALKNGGITMG